MEESRKVSGGGEVKTVPHLLTKHFPEGLKPTDFYVRVSAPQGTCRAGNAEVDHFLVLQAFSGGSSDTGQRGSPPIILDKHVLNGGEDAHSWKSACMPVAPRKSCKIFQEHSAEARALASFTRS